MSNNQQQEHDHILASFDPSWVQLREAEIRLGMVIADAIGKVLEDQRPARNLSEPND